MRRGRKGGGRQSGHLCAVTPILGAVSVHYAARVTVTVTVLAVYARYETVVVTGGPDV